jgi:hypothetical protein
MSNAEITAYNIGQRLAKEALGLWPQGQRLGDYPSTPFTEEETQAVNALGIDEAFVWIRRGGSDVFLANQPRGD